MTDLIERVFCAVFRFDLSGDRPELVKVAPGSKAKMPSALLEEVRVNRGELLAHLQASAREAESEGESTGSTCPRCRAWSMDRAHSAAGCPPERRTTSATVTADGVYSVTVGRCPWQA